MAFWVFYGFKNVEQGVFLIGMVGGVWCLVGVKVGVIELRGIIF